VATLKLRYAFLPNPNPIRASVAGANPGQIDLLVIITNPGDSPLATSSIDIHIPVGKEDGNRLSNSSLPQATSTVTGWQFASTGSDLVMTPAGDTGTIAGSLLLTLPAIQVNATPGVVQLKVTEYYADGMSATDPLTYVLVKKPSDFAVTAFTASRTVLYDIDQSVTLTWACTALGQKLDYSVHTDGWHPRDCENAGRCFSYMDGIAGVTTPELTGPTDYTLDVIEADPGGDRKVIASLQTSVDVQTPAISTASHGLGSRSGRIARLYWHAWNASSCVVHVDGDDVDVQAPLDTYEQGYFHLLAGPADNHSLGLTAIATAGKAQTYLPFGDIRAHDPQIVSLDPESYPTSIAMTPDGLHAFVVGADNVFSVDTARAQAHVVLPVSGPATVAITPGGAVALVTTGDGAVNTVDVGSGEVTGDPIDTRGSFGQLAISPGGDIAMLLDWRHDRVLVIDLATRTCEPNPIAVGHGPTALAFTPNGALALVTQTPDRQVRVIDVAKRTVEGVRIDVGGMPTQIAVTPDGRLAVVVDPSDSLVLVIDVARRAAAGPPIGVGGSPSGVVIAPDSRLALVPAATGAGLVGVDLAARAPLPGVVPLGQQPSAIAAAADFSCTAVANFRDGTVSLI
jgi:DNA-binding beta-propeller fold protein YncE